MQTEIFLSLSLEEHTKSARKSENIFLLPSKLPETQRKIPFPLKMRMTYSRHCLAPFSESVIGLKCSVNFGKRLKRNCRSDPSFFLWKDVICVATHLSSTLPKPDLPQNWWCVSQWGTSLSSPRSNKDLSLTLRFHQCKDSLSVAIPQVTGALVRRWTAWKQNLGDKEAKRQFLLLPNPHLFFQIQN